MNLPVLESPHLKNNLKQESLPWDLVLKIAELISVKALQCGLQLNSVNMLMHPNTCTQVLQVFSRVCISGPREP